ncbi:fluoride efflux transporter FluC [Sporosarcina sp. CAU 1771]
MKQVLMIGLAGALGAFARVSVGEVLAGESGFPFATFTVNIVGTFVLCFIITGAWRQLHLRKELEGAVTTGFLGSFTTFSALSIETLLLFENGNYLIALLYVGLSILGGLTVGMLGFHLGRMTVGK